MKYKTMVKQQKRELWTIFCNGIMRISEKELSDIYEKGKPKYLFNSAEEALKHLI